MSTTRFFNAPARCAVVLGLGRLHLPVAVPASMRLRLPDADAPPARIQTGRPAVETTAGRDAALAPSRESWIETRPEFLTRETTT